MISWQLLKPLSPPLPPHPSLASELTWLTSRFSLPQRRVEQPAAFAVAVKSDWIRWPSANGGLWRLWRPSAGEVTVPEAPLPSFDRTQTDQDPRPLSAAEAVHSRRRHRIERRKSPKRLTTVIREVNRALTSWMEIGTTGNLFCPYWFVWCFTVVVGVAFPEKRNIIS